MSARSVVGVRTADLSNAERDRLLPCGLPSRSFGGASSDVVGLAAVDLGVFALGTNPRRGLREGTGERGIAVTFAGVTVHPGCRVFADEDGVLVKVGVR